MSIAGHDYVNPYWSGVKKAVDEKFPQNKIEIIDSSWKVQL